MASSRVTLRFSRQPDGSQRNDEYGLALWKEDGPSLPWVLALNEVEGAVAYFRTRSRAVSFAEGIAERQEKLRAALRLIDTGSGAPDPADEIAREALR